jgi:hypothetical protein
MDQRRGAAPKAVGEDAWIDVASLALAGPSMRLGEALGVAGMHKWIKCEQLPWRAFPIRAE